MKKKLRKIAEDRFNLAYVPIWGLNDKELRIKQYEQILKEVYREGQQSIFVMNGDPVFRGIEFGHMRDEEWDDMKQYFTGRKQQPQVDPEKVYDQLERIVHHRFMAGYCQANRQDEQYTEHYRKADEAISKLLALLDIKDEQ